MQSHTRIPMERLMVLEMATACRRASSQTTRTRWRRRSLKRTAWLCRLEGGRATPVNRLPATRRLSGNVSHQVELNTGIYRKTSHRTLSLKFAVLPVAWCSPRGPSLLSPNMIHGAVPSLSLINNETNSKEKTQRYNLQLGYLSHYYCERRESIFHILKVI